MKLKKLIPILILVAGLGLLGLVLSLYLTRPVPNEVTLSSLTPNPQNGEYLLKIAGCMACHTAEIEDARGIKIMDSANAYAGGLELKTKFGNFITPNITFDKESGIGNWNLTEFDLAVRQGIGSENHKTHHLFPAIPYSYYQYLTDQDIVDLWARLGEITPNSKINPEHGIGFPFNIRAFQGIWKFLFVTNESLDQRFIPSSAHENDPVWQRGRYLVEAVTHCGACHTPPNFLGGAKEDLHLQGGLDLNSTKIPAISAEALLKNEWTIDDIAFALKTGMMVDGDYFGGSMAEVVQGGAKYLSDEDGKAIATYLLSK